MSAPHISVLLREVVQAFDGVEIKTFFDGTLGAGGHARAILATHPEIVRYIGCDRDPRAHEEALKTLAPWREKVEFVRGSYSELPDILKEREIGCIQGFLIDVGVSSMQLDERERGFSFRGDGPLDMRMDPSASLTAENIVNQYPEAEIARILFEYGEERRSRQIAKAIVAIRKKRPIRTAAELVKIVEPIVGRGPIHPATRVFQALRIAVNDELGELERGLEAAIEHVSPGGRIAVISFHSLEDRIAKTAFRKHEWREAKRGREASGSLKILTKKPAIPTAEEIRANARSRSAKLRIAEKIGG
ncbi:MAG: 16S rRNA (cytosine(1402)-N(4))-methyltransferase RsmH [Verrucomicrobia bacterium]|nr:16S rRNA (cytosine(1402)-N(4))-methyltransferase RsmH [Verrucomicrobiota bacterium]